MNDFESFMEWLADHNYAKVTLCENCYFWHEKNDREYELPFAKCRKHNMMKCHDDYCSDALEVKR